MGMMSGRLVFASGATGASGTGTPAAASAQNGSSPSCACCGGGSSEPIEGSATLEGDVQRITVDTSSGSYSPNVIKLVAGVPAEITFTESSGCLAEVQSADLGFWADLTSGGATVRIEADRLLPGTYGFSCGMQMVFGTIIVE